MQPEGLSGRVGAMEVTDNGGETERRQDPLLLPCEAGNYLKDVSARIYLSCGFFKVRNINKVLTSLLFMDKIYCTCTLCWITDVCVRDMTKPALQNKSLFSQK